MYDKTALPADGPKIKGGRPRYQLGEPVRVNCTSGGFSQPPTKLTWFINGEAANSAYLREYEPIVNARGLVLTRLGLEFTARQRHFLKGDLKLKVSSTEYCGKLLPNYTIPFVLPQCLATIATIYWRSNEESAANDRQQHQPPVPIPWEERATTAVLPSSNCATEFRSISLKLVLVLVLNFVLSLR